MRAEPIELPAPVQAAPDHVLATIAGLEAEIRDTMRTVDHLCRRAGMAPRYGSDQTDKPHSRPQFQAPAPADLLSPVAGRIGRPPEGAALAGHIDAWLSHMTARKKRPSTIGNYRLTVRAAIRETGWSSVEDFTFAKISGYLDGKVNSGEWKGATFNRNLSCLRSFTRYLRLMRLAPDNVLADVECAVNDSEPDCRAATLAEARALIRYAHSRELADKRCSGFRALYWLFLFSHGSRPGEPERLQWRHLCLDDEFPHVHWTKDIQKNHRSERVPLSPELVGRLRLHREAMRKLSAGSATVRRLDRRNHTVTLRCVSPADPTAFVFPRVPYKGTFIKDRELAGVRAKDERGLSLTGRSARKFFKTELIGRGVHGDLVRRLMRHAMHPDERYHDPSLADLAAAAANVPTLWPDDDQPPAIDADPGAEPCS